MAQSCSVYGLGVHVNVPIAALAGMPPAPRVDVRIAVGVEPPGRGDPASWREYYASPERDARGVHHIHVSRCDAPDRFRVAYEDGTRIYVDGAGREIWALGPEGATVEDTATYLLGPTLGFVLRLRGVTCLHASAVAIRGRAVALTGPSGFGKSSIAAQFARRGHAILGDDVAPIVERDSAYIVAPAYPSIRLWPESVRGLFGSHDALPRITPTWDKRYLALGAGPYRFQSEALPLAAIYLLGDRDDCANAARIEPVPARDALMGLVANTYTTYLLDKPMRAREFDVLSRLARHVPVRRATPAGSLARLDELCEAIEGDVDV